MSVFHPQYIVNENGERISVVLSISEYTRLIEELEELDDIRAYDEAIKDKGEFVDAKTAFEELDRVRARS